MEACRFLGGARGRHMALPGLRIDMDSIHIWYGDSETAPVLAIPKIPLVEIQQ